MSVYKKLQEARVRFHKLSLKKSGENKFAGYKYFELGDFIPIVQELFGELGLCGTIQFHSDRAQLKIVDVDKPEDAIYFISPSADVQLKGCLPIQGIGAAQTYLRRYLWVAALEIVENDVLDATTGKDEPKTKGSAKGTITPTDGALEALETAEQGRAKGIAKRMAELWKGEAESKDQAYDLYFANDLDPEMKVAVWGLLKPFSGMRSELKTMNESRRV